MSAFTPGMRLHDRYQLDEQIGAGGMAEVWRATDLVLGRGVAVKALDGQLARDPQLRAGARREAQAAAALSHPNITAIHDYSELALGDGRVIPYLVLELLSGETLAERLSRGALPPAQAATVTAQVAAALAAAHHAGVVHQDIKPANIMLTPAGAKVLDFGIAAIPGPAKGPHWIGGTPAYAAPERVHQAAPHPSADVFSLGVVAYEMTTGHPPWSIETWEQAASTDRTPPADTPALIVTALALDPAARPTAAEMRRAAASGSADNADHLDPAAPFADPSSAGPSSAGATRPGAGSDDALASATAALPVLARPSPTLIAKPGFLPGTARVPDRPARRYVEPTAPPPRRSPHITAAVTLILLLLMLGGIFIVAAVLQQSGGNVAAPPTSPTPAAKPSPTGLPTVSTSDDLATMLTTLRRAIDIAIIAGEIDPQNAENLRDRVDDLVDRQRRNRLTDFVKKAGDMRKEIADKADDGEISAPVAFALDTILAQLIERAQPGRG